MKKRLFALLSIVVVLSLFMTGTASATGQEKVASGPLQPGQTVTYTQTVPINLVFIGYSPADINKADLSSWLPATYEPLVRYPQFYGLPGRDMGLKYNFSYRYIFKDAAFNNRFFVYLRAIGLNKGLTYYQEAYNDQVNNIQDVNGPVLHIDAPTVEKYLATSLKMPAKSYTIVFINWYSRPDFKYHVYTKTNEPDPDTLYNFGALRSSRKLIAWGGTNSRLWFYDLSAGPEAWSGNYDVDNADLDGDAAPDYRMPPIWEYAAGGYRDPAELSLDLGMVTRFVGIDLLFTTSPLYDPLASAPSYAGKKVINVNMFEDDPTSTGTDYIDMSLVRARYKDFQPYYFWGTRLIDRNPVDAGAEQAFRIFTGLSGASDCWNAYGTPFAELFCYFDANRASYIPAYNPNDYVAGFFAYNTTDANLGYQAGLLGFADDNWIDGTPSYVFEFDSPGYRASGYGFTTTTIHEGGHHFGMSHPHDGYDYEYGIDYGPSGPLYFAWSGDESNTIMHYMDLTTKFGRFDKDNMYRWETAGYLNWSNQLLGDLMAHPNYASVLSYVNKAQYLAGASLSSFNQWNYAVSAMLAKQAYWSLAQAAKLLGVPTPDAVQPDRGAINTNVPHEGDPIRFPDN
jgi:hypothetical protein